MMKFFSIKEKNDLWDSQLNILLNVSSLIEDDEIISKPSCYYPRMRFTKKRGRVAFIELYKNICINNKVSLMSLDDFELFICKNKNWKVHKIPCEKNNVLETELIFETNEHNDFLNKFDLIEYNELPSINQDKEQLNNVSAIKNLCNNLDISKNEYIKIIKYFLEGLEQFDMPPYNL